MKRTCISVLAMWQLLSWTAWAQEADELEVELFFAPAETVTSAARHIQPLQLSPSAVSVLTREDIEASGARSLPEVLRTVPNMDIGMVNPLWYEVGVRGDTSSSDTVLLLVDDRDVTLEFFGFPAWTSQVFSMDDVERIEVIRGPGSALYGANAYSGVVHVITRPPGEGPRALASLRGGEHGLAEISVRAAERLGPLSLRASAGWAGEDLLTGRDRQAMGLTRGALDARLDLGAMGTLRLDSGISQVAGKFHSFMGPVDIDEMFTWYGRVRFQRDDTNLQIFYDRFDFAGKIRTEFYYADLDLLLAKVPPLSGAVDKLGVQAQQALEWFHNRVVLGTEYYYNHYHSAVFFEPDHDEHRVGLILQDEVDLQAILGKLWGLDLPPLVLTAGLRFDHNTLTRSELSPRASLVLVPAEGHSLRLGYARAFRKPAFFQSSLHIHLESQFGFDQLDLASPGLDNRTIDSLELGYGASFLGGRLKVQLDLAFNWYRNVIQFHLDPDQIDYIEVGGYRIPNLEDPPIYFYNDPDGKYGHNVELQVTGVPTERSRVFLVVGYRQLYDSSTGAFKTGEPVWRLAGGVDLGSRDGLSASARAFFTSRFNRTILGSRGLLEDWLSMDLPASLLVNARVAWNISAQPCRLSVGLEGFNLLGNAFRESAGEDIVNGPNFGAERLTRRVVFFLSGEM